MSYIKKITLDIVIWLKDIFMLGDEDYDSADILLCFLLCILIIEAIIGLLIIVLT